MIRFKSFVPRSKQDHRFDQILPTSSGTKKSFDFSYNKSPLNTDYSKFSQKSPTQLTNNRKKVNVVTFTPDESNELVSHNRCQTFGSTSASSNNSPTSEGSKTPISGSIPSILRVSRTSASKSDCVIDSNIFVVDSASKLIAAKRKAAKEIADMILNDGEMVKKKYSVPGEVLSKRAVSPEILRPEPKESTEWWSPDHMLPTPSIDTDRQDFRFTGTNKKIKVKNNSRPWQNYPVDEESENQYRLQAQNIVYRTNNEPINIPEEEDQLYVFDDNDDIDFSNCNNVRHKSSTKSNIECSTPKHRQVTQSNHTSSTSVVDAERYTIIENVKEAHECQEIGKTQDLLDDVDYLIEGLKSNLPASTRTLSIISLIGKCLVKSFRELVKAHSLLTKIFRYLEDAYLNESVAMYTAALFLVFSCDREPRIFDDSSLSLLLKLPRISKSRNGKNQAKPSKENERVRDKIRLMLSKLHHSNNGDHKMSEAEVTKPVSFHRSCACCRHLKLDNNVTTEDLVVECLLQLSSRKCADWFKSLLRKQHGLDIICDQVTSSVEYLGADLGPQNLDEFVMDRLYRLFNYMRFFEHMTYQNRENQSYLVDYCDAILIETLLRCLKLCAANLSYQPIDSDEKKLIQACLLANLRLLANISHDNEYTSNLLGSYSGLLKLIFSCLLHLPRFMSSGKRFDLSVLALALLINLAEHCSDNRRRMAHVNISRKRVACLGKCGQISQIESNITENHNSIKSMEFSFDDEVEDEDMDIDEDDNDDDPNQYINVDCESTDTTINVLEALVKLFLRHDDRAKNNTLIEGEEVTIGNTEDGDINICNEIDNDPKWRLVAERGLSRKNKSNKSRGLSNRGERLIELSETEDECSSEEEGADVEFMISSKEEEEELQKKLSAAGQHMQDSVVSAYAALLLGCIIKSSQSYMERIKQHLPLGKFKILAFVLAKFLSILSLTSGMGHTGEESILEIVRLLEAQDTQAVNDACAVTDDGKQCSNEEMMSSRPLCRSRARHCSPSSPPTAMLSQ